MVTVIPTASEDHSAGEQNGGEMTLSLQLGVILVAHEVG